MSRPKPRVIKEHSEGNYLIGQITSTPGITVLTYQGRPCGYKIVNTLTGDIKYPKVASVNPGFIVRLAQHLNEVYKCNDFAATLLGKNQ